MDIKKRLKQKVVSLNLDKIRITYHFKKAYTTSF